jgi:hypothetical protein
VSDIFREVEEDVRRERLEKLWKQYGDYIIAGVAVIVVGVAGFKLWQHYQAVQIAKASVAYSEAMQLSNGRSAEAALAFAKIVKDAPRGYAASAKLAEADALLASGRSADAIALYKTIAQKDKTELGNLARIRAAWALADNASRATCRRCWRRWPIRNRPGGSWCGKSTLIATSATARCTPPKANMTALWPQPKRPRLCASAPPPWRR